MMRWKILEEISNNLKCISHIFWVILSLGLVVLHWCLYLMEVLHKARTMGSNRKYLEPMNCDELKKNVTIWRILDKGGVMPFLEELHGFDPMVIAKVIDLSINGIIFFKDKKFSEAATNNFLKGKEKNRLVKSLKGENDTSPIKLLWAVVLKVLMQYLSLDGCFTRMYGHHFVLLNDFRHKSKISFPFYLWSLLDSSIKDHRKNHKSLILDEGLMLLIL